MGLFWTFGNHNKGRDAAAFLNWATIKNNNYSREAAAFLKATKNGREEAAAFLRQINGSLLDIWEPQLFFRAASLLELGNN